MSNTKDVALDIQALTETVERLEARVAALEGMLPSVPARRRLDDTMLTIALEEQLHVASVGVDAARSDIRNSDWSAIGAITLTGRTLIVLGGAYLLRALTEAAVIPSQAGAAAGFLYALVWLTQCGRTVKRDRTASGVFHGLAAALVGFPLVWEITARFALVSPTTGAVVLAIYCGLLLIAARRAHQQSVAWFAALGGVITAVILAYGTTATVPYTAVLALLGIATLWLGYVDDWVGVRWPVAAATDVMVLVLMVQALQPNSQIRAAAIAIQLSMLALYLGSFGARMVFLGREVIPFEIVQTAAAVIVGFGGALAVLVTSGVSVVPLGMTAFVAGAATYAFAFAYVEPRRLHRNVTFFASLAVVFSVGGVLLVLPRTAAVPVLGSLALISAEWARRSARLTLATHAFVFAAAMAWRSGLLESATVALLAPAAEATPRLDGSMLLALITMAGCIAWPMAPRLTVPPTGGSRALRISCLAMLIWMVSGVSVALLAALVSEPGSLSRQHAATVATIRTVVLAVVTTMLAAAPARSDRTERAWLGYAMLALIGIKLLAEDLPQGRPLTLFVALAVYGAALIVTPRLARRSAG